MTAESVSVASAPASSPNSTGEVILGAAGVACAFGAPLAADGPLHLVLASLAILGCGGYLWRVRECTRNGKAVVRLGLLFTLCWLCGVVVLALVYARMMSTFN